MRLINAILGDASEIDVEALETEFSRILAEGEQIQKAFILVRDLIVFTGKRMILVDKQGLTGKRKIYHSIPYRSILHFSVESLGHFDLDAELKIWIHGETQPREFGFRRDTSILEIQRALAANIP